MKKSLISIVAGGCIGAIMGAFITEKKMGKLVERWKTMSDKHLALFLLMNEWLKAKQDGKSVQKYIEKEGYHSVAIYGLSYVGERLVDELQGCGIEVKYVIDKNAETVYSDVKVYFPEEQLPNVDVIIVTAISSYDEIHDNLIKQVDCPVISLRDILTVL